MRLTSPFAIGRFNQGPNKLARWFGIVESNVMDVQQHRRGDKGHSALFGFAVAE